MSKTKQWLLSSLVLAVLIALVANGIQRWKENVVIQQDHQAKSRLKQLIDNKEFETAWRALRRVPHLSQDTEWQRLRMRVLVGRRNIVELNNVFQSAPENILANQEASILLARSFSHQRQDDAFLQIRNHWTKQSHETNHWLGLDIDRKLLAGNTSAVWEQLVELGSKDSLEANQLIQRALIRASTNSVAALEDLDRAFAADSRSPELRSFRAQVLESLGDKQLARIEYIAAHLSDPPNILWRDQLAEFYRRHQQFDFALATWAEGQSTNTTDYVFLKSHFWSRVASETTITNSPKLPSGPLLPLARMIRDLPEDQFWNEPAFLALPNHEAFRKNRQEVYWLSLLQNLKEGNDSTATELLGNRPFRHGLWDVYLHETLASILRYRKSDRFSPSGSAPASRLNITSNQHILVSLIKQFQREEIVNARTPTIPPALESLLKGPNAFTAALLASGWRQAALSFFKTTTDSALATYPSWFHYGLGQIMRHNASQEEAFTYLRSQPQTPDTQLLSAEILLGLKQIEKAKELLIALASKKSVEGARAAWLLAIDHLQQKRFKDATTFIGQNPNLSNSLRGKELSAKAAELTDNLSSATEIYSSIVDDSAQAKRFLADQAFRSQDFQTARTYTLALLQENPADLKIMANLRAIDSAIDSTP